MFFDKCKNPKELARIIENALRNPITNAADLAGHIRLIGGFNAQADIGYDELDRAVRGQEEIKQKFYKDMYIAARSCLIRLGLSLPQFCDNPMAGLQEIQERGKNAKAKSEATITPTDNGGGVHYEYNPHSRTLTCNGKEYKFNPSQGKVIETLYEAWRNPKKVSVLEKDIGAALDSSATSFRLLDLFRISGKYNPAWTDKIIERFGNKSYRLKP